MTLYLPDTTSLILFGRREPRVVEVLESLSVSEHVLVGCAITICEYYSGRFLGQDPDIDDFLSKLVFRDLTLADAMRAADYRRTYRRRGIQLQTTDTLIAALAFRLGATVLTENLKDFPMDDVSVASLLG